MEPKKVASIAIALIVVVVGILFLMQKSGTRVPDVSQNQNTSQTSPSLTRSDVPSGITVPEKNAQAASNVAVPEVVKNAGPNTTAKQREFAVEVNANKFVPDTVIARKGDVIHINFKAIDANYDFTQPDYGLSMKLPKGETKIVEAQFSATGKFTFYCASCGGPAKGPVGSIIVVEK